MFLNRVTLGRAVTFMRYLASVVSLIFLPKTLIWNKITIPASNSPNFAGLNFEEYLPKNLSIFLSLFNLSLLIIKILRACN